MHNHILSTLILSSMVLAAAPGCLADAGIADGALAEGDALAESEGALSLGTTLLSGQTMLANDTITSANGGFTARMQTDGNFVVYNNATTSPVWSTGSNGTNRTITLQTDGNLVVYASGAAIWSSSTAEQGTGSFFLRMEDSGSLVLYKGTPASPQGEMWSSRDAKLARKYAPIFRFHQDEYHFPVNMISFYRNAELHSESGSLLASSLQTEADITSRSASNKEDYLDLANTMYGDPASDGYNPNAPVYAHVVSYTKDGVGYYEILYSILFAYNDCEMFRSGSKREIWDSMSRTNFRWCNFGRHEGDWEHVTVRVNASTGSVVNLYTNAHGKKSERPSGDFEWQGNRPIVYVGKSTHGTYPRADWFHHSNIIDDSWSWIGAGLPEGLYQLDIVDVTGDGGHQWDTQPTIRLIGEAREITKFKGRWGHPRMNNSTVWDPEGNVPYVEDLEMRDFAQLLFNITDMLDDYKYGSGPNAPWTADWWWDGEGR